MHIFQPGSGLLRRGRSTGAHQKCAPHVFYVHTVFTDDIEKLPGMLEESFESFIALIFVSENSNKDRGKVIKMMHLP